MFFKKFFLLTRQAHKQRRRRLRRQHQGESYSGGHSIGAAIDDKNSNSPESPMSAVAERTTQVMLVREDPKGSAVVVVVE